MLDDLMVVAFDPQLGDPRLQIRTAMRSGQRLADSRSPIHDSCPAARVFFATSISPGSHASANVGTETAQPISLISLLRRPDIRPNPSLPGLVKRVACKLRRAITSLQDGIAKFVASVASQNRRVLVPRLGQTRRFRSLRMCGRSQA